MASLEDRLVTAEHEFLTALSMGHDALAAFDSHWENLMADADLAVQSGHVDPNLPTLVHHTATRIATLADISTELYVNYDNITTQFIGEIDILMSQLSLAEYSPVHLRITSSPKASQGPEDPPRKLTCKRRRDSADSLCGSTESRKRPRIATQSSDNATETTIQLKASLSTHQQLSRSPQNVPSHAHGLKRKRCSSDADCTVTRGPQKRLYLGPRLHAVSDSYRTFQVVSPWSYLPASSQTATQCIDSTVCLGGSRDTSELPSPDGGAEPCGSPCLTPLPCIGFSEADDWVHLSLDFLGQESQSSVPPTFDGMDLFLQSLTGTYWDEPSQSLRPSTPAGYGHCLNQTPSLVPNLVVDSMPSPTSSSSYPSTPSPQPSLNLEPAVLQFEPRLANVSLDESLLAFQSILPSASKEPHAHNAHDALLLMQPESHACDPVWTPLFLPTDSMVTFSNTDPTLSFLTMSSQGISSG